MKTSPEFKQVAAALTKAQPMFGVPKKDKLAQGTKYDYSYSDLADLMAAAQLGLGPNGLALIHVINTDEPGKPTLETILLHESGEWIAMHYPLIVDNDPQAFGSRLTYARRYSAAMLLGIAADKDDDGAAAAGKQGNRQGQGNRPAQTGTTTNRPTTTTGTTTTNRPPQPQNPAPEAAANSSGATTTTGTEGKPEPAALSDREQAIAFWRKWASKLNTAVTSNQWPEKNDSLAGVLAVNGAKTQMSAAMILANAKRIMDAVTGVTGEVADTVPEVVE